ncbi:Hypothetical predicted protein [Mytilus galloprovincialis]|uniref:Reverse transcriptase RNase H-like domain-containing protein n=1 Tax=Mytilus galloprovincialis TaxID=29158 RepID=A0A8B6DG36_MYTGA|nr:Hypothetical predicted protein [Mytilus galloprovincialis]
MKSTHTNVCQGNGTGVGYLKEKVDSWKEIGATIFVVDIIENGASWNAKVLVSTEALKECTFWLQNICSLNETGSQLCQLTFNEDQDYHLFCDASGKGFGGHLTAGSKDEPLEMFGSWSVNEQNKSSTWRELVAVKRVLHNFTNLIKDKIIRVYTDNKNVTHILRVGSRKASLHENVMQIHEICKNQSIKLSSVWIPREQNTHADMLSRRSDCDDWEGENLTKEGRGQSGIFGQQFLKFRLIAEVTTQSNLILMLLKRWERFISLHGHVALPAQPVHVALYLTDLVNNGSTYHPVYNAIYGIKWAHEINSLKDPTTNTFVTSILEASKRVAPKKTNKKDPVTTDVLIELCFLRYDELSSLRFLDIDIQDSFLILHITKSKTDQYRQSNEVIIAKGSTIACPYNMLVKYTRLAGFSSHENKFLFRPIYRSGELCKLINKDKKLSYTAARECLLKRIRIIRPGCNIGLHSFRSGGATVAANADVSDRCLKKHGRWKSDSSKDGYIVDSIEKRLKISQVLGL